MLPLQIPSPRTSPLRILCLGAHSDDIEIGCGGSILRILAEYGEVDVHWVVLSGAGARADEARTSAARFLEGASDARVQIADFQDSHFPSQIREIKLYFEQLKGEHPPDLIFTHYRHDLHQDHRVVSDLTWNTFRDHWILEYEIFKYDGDLGTPNFFIPLDKDMAESKVSILMESFVSQTSHRWFNPETFYSLMHLRGMECNARHGRAEAFHCRKVCV